MFDRVILCSQGNTGEFANNQTLHALLRAKKLILNEGDVRVYFVPSAEPFTSKQVAELRNWTVDQSNLNNVVVVNESAQFSDGESNYMAYEIEATASMLSELHVVAWGDVKGFNSKPNDGTYFTGYLIIVTVCNRVFLAAYSYEQLECSSDLKMTFDVEETNGVLQATADFDGMITQGIFDKLQNNYYTKDEVDSLVSNSGGGGCFCDFTSVSSSIISTSNYYDLGSYNSRWGTAYITSLNVDGLHFNNYNQGLDCQCHLTPYSSDMYNLGSESYRWYNVYASTLYGINANLYSDGIGGIYFFCFTFSSKNGTIPRGTRVSEFSSLGFVVESVSEMLDDMGGSVETTLNGDYITLMSCNTISARQFIPCLRVS